MVFSNPLSFSFAIPNVNEKHKHKIIVINRSYTIINICLISDIFAKNIIIFLAENVRRFNFSFVHFAPFFKKQIMKSKQSNNINIMKKDQFFFERNARCSNFYLLLTLQFCRKSG